MTLYHKKAYDTPFSRERVVYCPASYWAVGEVREGKVGKIFRKKWADLSHCIPLTGYTPESLLLLNVLEQCRLLAVQRGQIEKPYIRPNDHDQEQLTRLGKIEIYGYPFTRVLSCTASSLYEAGKPIIDRYVVDTSLLAAMSALKSAKPEDRGYNEVRALVQKIIKECAEEVVEAHHVSESARKAQQAFKKSESERTEMMLNKSDKEVRETRLGSIAALLKSRLELSN